MYQGCRIDTKDLYYAVLWVCFLCVLTNLFTEKSHLFILFEQNEESYGSIPMYIHLYKDCTLLYEILSQYHLL